MEDTTSKIYSNSTTDSAYFSLPSSDHHDSHSQNTFEKSANELPLASGQYNSYTALFEYLKKLVFASWTCDHFSQLPADQKDEGNKLLWQQDDDDDEEL